MKLTTRIAALLLLLLATTAAAEYTTLENIPYRTQTEHAAAPYIAERCVLDLYHPKDTKNFATILWFHGGGLKGGNKSVILVTPYSISIILYKVN